VSRRKEEEKVWSLGLVAVLVVAAPVVFCLIMRFVPFSVPVVEQTAMGRLTVIVQPTVAKDARQLNLGFVAENAPYVNVWGMTFSCQGGEVGKQLALEFYYHNRLFARTLCKGGEADFNFDVPIHVVVEENGMRVVAVPQWGRFEIALLGARGLMRWLLVDTLHEWATIGGESKRAGVN